LFYKQFLSSLGIAYSLEACSKCLTEYNSNTCRELVMLEPSSPETAINKASLTLYKLFSKSTQQKPSFAVQDSTSIHFLATSAKGPNYLEFSNNVVLPEDPVKTLQMYTDHSNELYSEVNISLAADGYTISEHSKYIDELRASIIATPLLDDCVVYRGVQLSQLEIDTMVNLKRFFIPSFTSTTTDPTKIYKKNTTLVIKLPFMCKYACSITSNLSKYYESEKEVLIACYSAFFLESLEVINGANVITLSLDELGSSCNSL